MYREHTVLGNTHEFIKSRLQNTMYEWVLVEVEDPKTGNPVASSHARAAINKVGREMGLVLITSDQVDLGLLHAKRIA